ncbi:MAG: hypothetical protein QOJ61_1275, partial [Mycobacterium sp.]|nr:hypothetical protein [Mycobacterium sp.]
MVTPWYEGESQFAGGIRGEHN